MSKPLSVFHSSRVKNTWQARRPGSLVGTLEILLVARVGGCEFGVSELAV